MREHRIYDKPKLRLTVEGILYRLRTGIPWRDLPPEFGKWNSIFKQFNNWSKQKKLMKIFRTLSKSPDTEWEFLDGTIVKAHQHSAGAAGQNNQAIGKSRGGNSTKIHMAVDSYGLPLEFVITGGEVHDCKIAPVLLAQLPLANHVIADKAYDSDDFRKQIEETEAMAVIPRKNNSKVGNDGLDWCLYKYRHLVENAFARLKHFRAFATRYDKLKRNYESMVALACGIMWLPM